MGGDFFVSPGSPMKVRCSIQKCASSRAPGSRKSGSGSTGGSKAPRTSIGDVDTLDGQRAVIDALVQETEKVRAPRVLVWFCGGVLCTVVLRAVFALFDSEFLLVGLFTLLVSTDTALPE